MTLKEAMAELKKMGTAQNVKVYRRHGAKGDLFGVSFANLGALKKKIRKDHALALELWKTGNVDARTLACMIADPKELTARTADAWVKQIDYYCVADQFSALVAQSPHAITTMQKWMKSRKEYVRQCGYSVLSSLLAKREDVPDELCEELLAAIEKEIHASANRARYTMNGALISIGIFKPALRAKAVAAAKRIGHVEVDHGETGCKTPDAVPYIEKAAAHYAGKAKGRAASAVKKKSAKKKSAKKATASKKSAKKSAKKKTARS